MVVPGVPLGQPPSVTSSTQSPVIRSQQPANWTQLASQVPSLDQMRVGSVPLPHSLRRWSFSHVPVRVLQQEPVFSRQGAFGAMTHCESAVQTLPPGVTDGKVQVLPGGHRSSPLHPMGESATQVPLVVTEEPAGGGHSALEPMLLHATVGQGSQPSQKAQSAPPGTALHGCCSATQVWPPGQPTGGVQFGSQQPTPVEGVHDAAPLHLPMVWQNPFDW